MVVEFNLHGGAGLTRGDQFSIRRILTNIPSGSVIAEAWLTVKADLADLDGAAIFQKDITTTEAVGTGKVEKTGSNGVGVIRFDISATNTLAFTAGVSYYYDIQILLDTGNILTLESGHFTPAEQVTIDA